MSQDDSNLGARLHFRRYGEGPALVVLHGFLGAGGNWHTLASNVFGKQFATYTPDQRNHGRSPHSRRIDYPLLADDLRAFLDAQGIDSAHVLGHSMGGKVAMQFACTHPERIDRLVVVDIAPKTYPPHHLVILQGLRAVDPEQHASRSEVDQALAEHVPSALVRQFLLKNLAFDSESRRYYWEMNLETLYAEYDKLNAAPPCDTPFEGPTLFIRGERSNYISGDDEAIIRARFPHARIETVPGAGHWVHADAPEALGGLVMDFLTGAA